MQYRKQKTQMESQNDCQDQDRINEALTNPYIEDYEGEMVYPLSSIESTNQFPSPYIDPEVLYTNKKTISQNEQQKKKTTEKHVVHYAIKENNSLCCFCISLKIIIIMLVIIFVFVYLLFFH